MALAKPKPATAITGGKALVVSEPQHQVLDRGQVADAQTDTHDRAVADEHAGQESQCDAHARTGETDHKADH